MEFDQQSAQGARAVKRLAQACCAEYNSPSSSVSCSSQVEQKRQRSGCTSCERMLMDSNIGSSIPSTVSISSTGPSSACSDGTEITAASPLSVCSTCSPQPHSPTESLDIRQWRSRDAEYTPQNIFKLQDSITPAMREMLVEWMCEVVIQHRMHLETFLLAVNYLDRYMCKKAVPRSSFQLLGLTCLWAAAKYEEVHPPSLRQLLEAADHAYSKEQMIHMEGDIMLALAWTLSPTTSLKFMQLYLVECQATSLTVQAVGECMLQLASLDYALCAEQPAAHVAAAAACVALTTCQLTHLVPQVVVASGWADAHALAQMSHDLYARFAQLAAPGMRFHPVIAHYSQRQRAISRQAQLEQAMAEMVAKANRTAAAYPQGAVRPTSAATAKLAPGTASLHASVAAKLAMANAGKNSALDCMPSQDQTHKIYNLLALKQHQQQMAALAASRRAAEAMSGMTGGAVMPHSSMAYAQHGCVWRT